jgi:cyanophycin synthetase
MKITLIQKPKYFAGYFEGLRHPTLHIPIQCEGALPSVSEIKTLNEALSAEFPSYRYETEDETSYFFSSVLHWIYAGTKSADIPVFETGKVHPLPKGRYLLLIPCVTLTSAQSIEKLVRQIIQIFNAGFITPHASQLRGVIQKIQETQKGGTNVPRFLKAAYEMHIPFMEVASQLNQYGYGSRLRLMDSSFTDETPQIAARLARDKFIGLGFLRQAGIPVARQSKVTSEEEALKAAAAIGYPVVVKAANLDGGVGVHAGLLSPQEVVTAYRDVKKHTSYILVEQHIYGRDYRIIIFHDEVSWAIERVPPGVTGDGESSIKTLIEKTNADPRRGQEGTHTLLKKLQLDAEAMKLLKQANCTPDTILLEGAFVALRRKANISAGGMPVGVMDKIHPDNAALAIRATKLMHLDIAGVDLLTKDISQSWKENGGAICEVNSQPQLGGVTSAHVYGEILQRLVKEDGRIPIVLIVGDRDDALMDEVDSYFHSKGLKTGLVHSKGVSITGNYILDKDPGLYEGGKMLLMDKSVEAIIICVRDIRVLNTGLPFDRYDALIIAGNNIHLPQQANITKERATTQVLKTLLPACTNQVIQLADADVEIPKEYQTKVSKKTMRKNALSAVKKMFT